VEAPPGSKPGRLAYVSKVSRLTLEFGCFQDFVRINKSLLSTKAERDLGLWPKGAGENASRRVRSDSGRCAHRFEDWSDEVSNRKTETETRRTSRREMPLGFAAPDHTVPYGTVLWRDAFPGTSCRATIGVVPPGHRVRVKQLLELEHQTGRWDLSVSPSGLVMVNRCHLSLCPEREGLIFSVPCQCRPEADCVFKLVASNPSFLSGRSKWWD
jgi:hypothetical protein